MLVKVRCLDMPKEDDLLWQSFNCQIPREKEGVIIIDRAKPDALVKTYEVARITYEMSIWHEKDGSLDTVTIWVKKIRVN
jgi:hypothetical protein